MAVMVREGPAMAAGQVVEHVPGRLAGEAVPVAAGEVGEALAGAGFEGGEQNWRDKARK